MIHPLKAVTLAFVALWTASATHGAWADAVADFYKDKHIELIISSTVGGGNDLSARLIARHFTRNMPGHPVVVARNMPGAGGLTMANHLYNVAPRDGLAIGMVQNSAVFDPLFGSDKAKFDVAKFNWLGSPSKDVGVLIVWHTVPVNSFAEAQKRGLMLGVSGGLNATPAFYARVFTAVFDMPVKMIAGYPGQAEAFLAMERGENEGYPSVFWSSLKVGRADWLREKKIKLLLHFGAKPHPELADVPFAPDVIKDPQKRQLMELASAPLAVGRPMMAPPGVPAERVRALQDALFGTLKDPQYLAECEKQNLECDDPTTGAELAKIIEDTYNAPKELVSKLRELNNAWR